jgi:hypothetical protein
LWVKRPLFSQSLLARSLLAVGGTALIGGALLAAGPAASAALAATTTTTPATATTTTAPATTVTPTDSWLKKAVAAEAKLGSVHINGTIIQGKHGIALSLLVNGDGEGGGSFTQDGSRIQLKRVGPLLYFNAPAKYWSSHANAAQTKKYGGKWIEVSALDTRFQSFDQFLDAGDLTAAVFEGYTKALTVSKTTTLDGHKVVIVSDTAKAKGKKSSVKMYIDATGKPYVVRIFDQGPTQSTTLNFTSYGKPVSINTPAEPINLTG